jgi:hypothetical protein
LNEEEKTFLLEHNVYRCMHGVAPLTWDNEIARIAQAWADQIAAENSLRHGGMGGYSGGGLGQNLAKGANAANSVKMWYSEVKYTKDGIQKQFSMDTGHYTQVVWRGSTKLGCGVKKGPNQVPTVVCNYFEPGNMQGAFQENVFARQQKEEDCRAQMRRQNAISPSEKAKLNPDKSNAHDNQEEEQERDQPQGGPWGEATTTRYTGYNACPGSQPFCNGDAQGLGAGRKCVLMGENAGQWTEGGKLYGTAAVSNTLLNGKSGCGKCYDLEVTEKCGNPYHKGGCNNNANQASAGKRITVMATNLCPDEPACPKHPGQSNIYGKTVHFDICWHDNQLGSMDNAMVKYREVPCPGAITKRMDCTGGIGGDSGSVGGAQEEADGSADELDDLDEDQGMHMVQKVMKSSNHRCKNQGMLKSLGQDMAAEDCAEKCRLDPDCKFAQYQVGKTRKCSSFEKCVAIKNPNTWMVFEKMAGATTTTTTTTSTTKSSSMSKSATTTITTQAPTTATNTMIVRASLTLLAENFRRGDDESFIGSVEESLARQLGVDKTWVQVTEFEQSGGRRLRTALLRRLLKTKITARFEVIPAEPTQIEVSKIVANLEAPEFARSFTNELIAVENRKGSTIIIDEVALSAPEVAAVASGVSSEKSTTEAPVTTAIPDSTTTPMSEEKVTFSTTPRTAKSPVSGEKTGIQSPAINTTMEDVPAPASIENLTHSGIDPEWLANRYNVTDFFSTSRAMMKSSVIVPLLLMVMSSTRGGLARMVM